MRTPDIIFFYEINRFDVFEAEGKKTNSQFKRIIRKMVNLDHSAMR